MFGLTFTISKRHLGLAALVLGIGGVLAVALFDQLGLSDPQGGFGPSQTLGLALSILSILFGLSLLPLGDTPA